MRDELEGGPQLHLHGGHEVVLLEQQQRLAVDLLRAEHVRVVAAAGQAPHKLKHVLHLRKEKGLQVKVKVPAE